jgi:hypothetical protein
MLASSVRQLVLDPNAAELRKGFPFAGFRSDPAM